MLIEVCLLKTDEIHYQNQAHLDFIFIYDVSNISFTVLQEIFTLLQLV